MPTHRTTLAAGALIALVASLSACGPSEPSTNADPSPLDTALAFSTCMRAEGISFPDPQPDGRILLGRDGNGSVAFDPDSAEFKAAQTKCGDETGFVSGSSGPVDEEARDTMVAFAECMRDQGIDMPDPSDSGKVVIEPDGAGFDPGGEAFQEALGQCRTLMPTPPGRPR